MICCDDSTEISYGADAVDLHCRSEDVDDLEALGRAVW